MSQEAASQSDSQSAVEATTDAILAMTTSPTAEAPPLQTSAAEYAHLVEVAFKGNRREFFTWAFPEPPALRTPVIVDADRGEDLGLIHSIGELATTRKAGTPHGKASPDQLRAALRVATSDDVVKGAQLRTDEDNVRRRAIEKVRAQNLDMKVSDTEWQWDRKKLTIYFTAEKRVDFRQLVRQLEGLFGTRVQMWHIGVRDEARRLDGIGRCARQFCSASWLPELRPVKSSVAKDQRLSTLNPSQISGSCGRLMCCLRYEHEFYVQQRKRFPKEGKIIVTLAGEEKIVSNDIFREQVTLRGATGEVRIVPLAQLNRELGGEPITGASDLASDDESDFDEEVTSEMYLVDPPRGADTHTYPGTPPMERKPSAPPAPNAQRQQQQRPPREKDARKDPQKHEGRQQSSQQREPQREQNSRYQGPREQKPREQRPRDQAPREQKPRDQTPRDQKPRDPQQRDAQQQQDESQQPGAEGGRRRRRRGRRGGRRGREGGAPGAPNGPPGTPPAPPAPPTGT